MDRDPPPVLQLGDAGPAVELLQKALNAHVLTVDGDFGLATHYAVCAFQASNGLVEDGVVDAATWKALDTERKDLRQGAGRPPP